MFEIPISTTHPYHSFELDEETSSDCECKESKDNDFNHDDILPQQEKSLIQTWSEWVITSIGANISLIASSNSEETDTNTNKFDQGRCYEEMGLAKAYCGNTTEALCFFDLALQAKRKECNKTSYSSSSDSNDDDYNNASLTSTLLNRARAFGKMDLLRSCTEYKEIIQRQEEARSAPCIASTKKEDLFLANMLLELAHVQCKRGDFTNGIPNFYTALNIRVGHLGTQHEDVAFVWYMIGKTYHIKRDYRNAMTAYRKSLKIYTLERNKKKNHALIHAIQRLISNRTMVADISMKHWEDNATV